jgi:hypothetical protein
VYIHVHNALSLTVCACHCHQASNISHHVCCTCITQKHRFFPLCLGSEEQAQADPKYVTLPQLMRDHVKNQRADLLKVRLYCESGP